MANDILLRARSHFRATRTVESLQKLEVPEWDLTLHYWPALSVDEARETGRHIRIGGGTAQINAGDLTDAAVSHVLNRARDPHGVRLFSDEDEAGLRDTDPSVLQRIASTMGWGGRPSVEDAEKN